MQGPREHTGRHAAVPLAGWGRQRVLPCRLASARQMADVCRHLCGGGSLIARGAGRAYGDAALNQQLTLSMLGLDRLQRFDADSGALTCEAGVLLADILRVFTPRGWFPPVVPGTRFVTVGGMIAADVHGKNHHRDGSFGNHLDSLVLLTGDGQTRHCSRERNADLFRATQGGMGLTGAILAATFRLRRIETAFVETETIAAGGLAEAMSVFEADERAGDDWPYSVAWVDCQGRSGPRGRCVLSHGRFAPRSRLQARQRRAPLATTADKALRPPWPALAPLLRPGTVAAFNHLHYALSSRRGHARASRRLSTTHFERFFFPLDRLRDWNLAYGRGGFVQHQCVLPKAASAAGLLALMKEMERAGLGAYLAVLKLFGAGSGAPLSFPMRGYTLALDLPMRRETPALLEGLDAVVHDHGGRVYLAKDAHSTPRRLRQGYPGIDAFTALRTRVGSAPRFTSALAQRLRL